VRRGELTSHPASCCDVDPCLPRGGHHRIGRLDPKRAASRDHLNVGVVALAAALTRWCHALSGVSEQLSWT